MSLETRQTILHDQLQEGLWYNLMKAPAVSGAQNYPELCMADINDEKHLTEPKKWKEYQRPTANPPAECSFRKSPRYTNSANPSSSNLQSSQQEDPRIGPVATSVAVLTSWLGTVEPKRLRAMAITKIRGGILLVPRQC